MIFLDQERLDETTKPFLNRDSGKGKDPMAKSNTPNERIKRAYIDFLRQAMGRSEASLEAVAAARQSQYLRQDCPSSFLLKGEF